MPGQLTQSIRPSGQGGDFTSLSSWESQNLNLVSLDSASYVAIEGDWSGSTDGVVTIGGWTTSPTNNVTIEVLGSARHSGVWDDTKYVLAGSRGSSGDLGQIKVSNSNFNFRGLQIDVTVNKYDAYGIENSTGGNTYDGLIIRGVPGANSWYAAFILWQGSGVINISNCLFYNFTSGANNFGYIQYVTGYDVKIYNVTVINSPYTFYKNVSGGTLELINCLSQQSANGFRNLYLSSSSDYNASDIVGNAPGSNSRTGTVTFVDSASFNFNISGSDTVVKNYGYDLYNNGRVTWNNDIVGNTRQSGSWDIGAFEYIEASIGQLTQSIRPSGQGGDFTSLSSWESQNLNLVSLNSSSYAMIDGDWSGSYDTPRIQLAGWTTDETHTITIECVGTGSRHSGIWDETKYKLQGSTGAILITSVKYVTLKGLQLEHSGDNTNQNNCIWWQYSTGSIVIDSVIVKGMTNFTGNPWLFTTDRDSGSVYIKNSLFYNYSGTGADTRGITTYASNVNFYLYNNTFFNVRKSITGNTLFTCVNNITQKSNDGFVGTFNASSDYNVSDISSDAPGANSITGTVSFFDSASYNFTIASDDTIAKYNGYDLYNNGVVNWNTDIIGNTRTSGSWDIGAFSFVFIPVTSSNTYIKNIYTNRFSSIILIS